MNYSIQDKNILKGIINDLKKSLNEDTLDNFRKIHQKMNDLINTKQTNWDYTNDICDASHCYCKNESFKINLHCGHQFHFNCFKSNNHNKKCIICNKELFASNMIYDIIGDISIKNMYEMIIKSDLMYCKNKDCMNHEYPMNKGYCKQHRYTYIDDTMMRKLIMMVYFLSNETFIPLRLRQSLDMYIKLANSYAIENNINVNQIDIKVLMKKMSNIFKVNKNIMSFKQAYNIFQIKYDKL
jgi:hypothetical protein